MRVVPGKAIQKVQFYETHLTPWAANAVAIGTMAALVTDLTTKTTAARAAYDAQQSVRAAAKAATLSLGTAVGATGATGAAGAETRNQKPEQNPKKRNLKSERRRFGFRHCIPSDFVLVSGFWFRASLPSSPTPSPQRSISCRCETNC